MTDLNYLVELTPFERKLLARIQDLEAAVSRMQNNIQCEDCKMIFRDGYAYGEHKCSGYR